MLSVAIHFNFLFLQPINLKGEKFLLKGHISVESNEDVPENIPVDILDDKETLVAGTIARLVPAGVDQAGAAVFEYSFWANFGENLIFVPQDSRYVCSYVAVFGIWCKLNSYCFVFSQVQFFLEELILLYM